jgi:hypothetical protein
MPSAHIEPVGGFSAPSLIPAGISSLTDEGCVERLALAVEEHDSGHLDELAQLFGRLAVMIE